MRGGHFSRRYDALYGPLPAESAAENVAAAEQKVAAAEQKVAAAEAAAAAPPAAAPPAAAPSAASGFVARASGLGETEPSGAARPSAPLEVSPEVMAAYVGGRFDLVPRRGGLSGSAR